MPGDDDDERYAEWQARLASFQWRLRNASDEIHDRNGTTRRTHPNILDDAFVLFGEVKNYVARERTHRKRWKRHVHTQRAIRAKERLVYMRLGRVVEWVVATHGIDNRHKGSTLYWIRWAYDDWMARDRTLDPGGDIENDPLDPDRHYSVWDNEGAVDE